MKFGGTSVANEEAISRTISIVEGKLSEKPIVVVSALSKVTDLLYKICDAASKKNRIEMLELSAQLRARHLELCEKLLGEDSDVLSAAKSKVDSICNELDTIVGAVCTLGELSERSKAIIISAGEYLSSNIICSAMNLRGIKTKLMNARNMIVTGNDYMKAEPVLAEIEARVPAIVNEAFDGMDAVITQGFVSATLGGEPTVLGRGGSDYTASLIGMAIDAERIEIWTDVDGVKTADPRSVRSTLTLDRLSFEEAAEMAHFGAKVLHPLTIEPAVKKNIPIKVLNSTNPEGNGTTILHSDMIEDGVKSVSFKENILIINIFSTKMIDVSGFVAKVFGIFSEKNVSVDLISTSEANISVTVDASQENIDDVVKALSAFAKVELDYNKAQVSVIGKNIGGNNCMLKEIFSPVSEHTVYMVSQGASYINVSLVVDKSALQEVVQSIHDLLFFQAQMYDYIRYNGY